MPNLKHPVQLATGNFATGTWARTAGTSSELAYIAKTATDETSVIEVNFGLPGLQDGPGARLLAVTLHAQVRTAALDGVITATLTRHNAFMAEVVPVQTFTANPNGSVITTATRVYAPGTLVTVASGTTLPAGLAASTNYYVGYVNPVAPVKSEVLLYSTLGQALAGGTAGQVTFTDAGTGTHTMTSTDVSHTSMPITIAGDQVTAGSLWREVNFNVTTPAWENVDTNTTKNYFTYSLLVTVNNGTSTVPRISDIAWVSYDRPGGTLY
jgi:hypothetical protein